MLYSAPNPKHVEGPHDAYGRCGADNAFPAAAADAAGSERRLILIEDSPGTGLEESGFADVESVSALQRSMSRVPRDPGIYVVLAPSTGEGRFLPEGTGGAFKGKDPNVATDLLASRWHASASVAWRAEVDPRASEVTLLGEFVERYGPLPFANISN